MKLCLALMFQNEAAWLKLHLPVMLDAVDGLVGLDGGSTDGGADVIRGFGGTVYERPFDWQFGKQAQALVDAVESEGYDAILRLDPDEAMFPRDIRGIREQLEPNDDYVLLHLPRITFIRDRLHYSPVLDTSPQWRAWRLHRGISYRHGGEYPRVHETPAFAPDNPLMTMEVPQTIYHYGGIKDPYDCHWRGLAYNALIANQPIPSYAPEPTPWYPHERFDGEQPIDPEEVGYRAPLDAVGMNYHLSSNLAGDRTIEYDFVKRAIPPRYGNGAALDFGSGGVGELSSAMLHAGWRVTAFDREPVGTPFGVGLAVGDILQQALPETYHLIVCCSAIEHVGLAGRYGTTEQCDDGDLIAMRRLYDALESGGTLLLTLPVGVDRVHMPMHRVYGERLDGLLEGFEVHEWAYWRKVGGDWQPCSKTEARASVSVATSTTDWQGCVYALGAFKLVKP